MHDSTVPPGVALTPPILPNLYPVRPKVINYQVNDICNARCVMCHIWKKDRDSELSPDEFGALLGNTFFSEVEHVGITGGEPTLRPDLDRFYAQAIERLPNLKGSSFITNGFSPSRARDVYGRAARACSQAGVHFSGMVSVDGVGDVHDTVRGRSGAFKRAERTIAELREERIEVIACCTIVAENVFGLHDLLDWGRRNGLYLRFRVAEFINRLYNSSATDQILAFDRAQTKHLVSFFHLLLTEYEKTQSVQRTYLSILSRLTGGPRLTACPYQSSWAINLDSRGRFAHCAPKGTPRALGRLPALSFLGHAAERVDILRRSCPDCIHDYHADWSSYYQRIVRRDQQRLACDKPIVGTLDRDVSPFDVRAMKRLLLVGWYGTETAGDIAILGGIVWEYLQVNPNLRFTLASLNQYYTRLTVHDLPPAHAARISVTSWTSMAPKIAAKQHDAVVMAGGPLMDIQETRGIAAYFEAFARKGKPCVMEGCGIGPLHVPRFRDNVLQIGRLATSIRLRDSDSRVRLQELGINKLITIRPDPSTRFIRETGIGWSPGSGGPIRCYFRELTPEYLQSTSPAAAEELLSATLQKLLAWYPDATIELLAMHFFPIGWDDRVLARRLCQLIADPRLRFVQAPLSPQEILESMASARFCVCMRFHSVVFAHTIGCRFAAIDYTDGGKIRGFLKDNGLGDKLIRLPDLDTLTLAAFEAALGTEKRGRLAEQRGA